MLSSSCMLGTNHQLAVILRLCSTLGVPFFGALRFGSGMAATDSLWRSVPSVWRYLKGVEPMWSLTGGSGSLSGL